jgi:chaperonin GroES
MVEEIVLDDEAVEQEAAPIPPEQFIQMVTQSDNLATEITDDQLALIAQDVLSDYEMDKSSMEDWEKQMKRGIDLAKMVKADKSYPFGDKSANVCYPLVTSAALHFNARAYPAIVPADQVVQVQTHGKDPQGLKAARGERVSEYMSWQLLNEVEEWEEETDNLLTILSIVGTKVRKWWYDPIAQRPRCRLIESGAFIVNDKVKNLNDAPRVSEEIHLYPAEIETRIRTGQFVEFSAKAEDEDKQAAQLFIEQHRRIDLDEDGYEEPYIVTVHEDTGKVVRLVADFDVEDVVFQKEQRQVEVMTPALQAQIDPATGQMISSQVMIPQIVMQEVVTGITHIRRGSYFVAFKFMPGLDGGFHGTGLGLLLGDISDTVNTIINMMLNAGHMASLGGGFIGTEFRLKGGDQRFKPGEWKQAQVPGGDVRNAVVPMTFPGPDGTLFQMLGLLIEAGKEISSTKDIMSGDPGPKNMTATATLALIEQGMMVFTAAYKRIFRSLKQEFKLLAKINAQTLSADKYNAFHDAGVQLDPAADFGADDLDITPVADPRSVTKMQQMAKADLIGNLAERGMVSPQAAAKRVLEAADIGDIEELMPPPDPEQQAAAKRSQMMNDEMMKAKLVRELVEIDRILAQIEGEKADAAKTMADTVNSVASMRLQQTQMMMEQRRQAIEGIISGGMGGMAGQPGNAVDPRQLGPNAGPPPPMGAGPVLAGQPRVGGIPAGPGGLGRVA